MKQHYTGCYKTRINRTCASPSPTSSTKTCSKGLCNDLDVGTLPAAGSTGGHCTKCVRTCRRQTLHPAIYMSTLRSAPTQSACACITCRPHKHSSTAENTSANSAGTLTPGTCPTSKQSPTAKELLALLVWWHSLAKQHTHTMRCHALLRRMCSSCNYWSQTPCLPTTTDACSLQITHSDEQLPHCKRLQDQRYQQRSRCHNTCNLRAAPGLGLKPLLLSCTACMSFRRLGRSCATRFAVCTRSSNHPLLSTAPAAAMLCWTDPAASTPHRMRLGPAALLAGCTGHTPHQAQRNPAVAATCTARLSQNKASTR